MCLRIVWQESSESTSFTAGFLCFIDILGCLSLSFMFYLWDITPSSECLYKKGNYCQILHYFQYPGLNNNSNFRVYFKLNSAFYITEWISQIYFLITVYQKRICIIYVFILICLRATGKRIVFRNNRQKEFSK